MTRKCNFRLCRYHSGGECVDLLKRAECVQMVRDVMPDAADLVELLEDAADDSTGAGQPEEQPHIVNTDTE